MHYTQNAVLLSMKTKQKFISNIKQSKRGKKGVNKNTIHSSGYISKITSMADLILRCPMHMTSGVEVWS